MVEPACNCWREGWTTGELLRDVKHCARTTTHMLSTWKMSNVTSSYESTASTINVFDRGITLSDRSLASPAATRACRLQLRQLLDPDACVRRITETCNERAWHMDKSNDWSEECWLAWQHETSVTASPPGVSTVVSCFVCQSWDDSRLYYVPQMQRE